jgi:hypothetical protein
MEFAPNCPTDSDRRADDSCKLIGVILPWIALQTLSEQHFTAEKPLHAQLLR